MNECDHSVCKEALTDVLILHGGFNRVEIHRDLVLSLNQLYERKNTDYGNSFAAQRLKEPSSILIRLYDKYLRIEQLLKSGVAKVTDESIEDTLLDLANYALMEVVERRIEKKAQAKCDEILASPTKKQNAVRASTAFEKEAP